jgi:cell division protease FtsH
MKAKSRNFRNFALWMIIVLLLLALFTVFQNPGQRSVTQVISFSQFLTNVDQGKVRDVVIQGSEIYGTYTDGRSFNTYAPNDPMLVQHLYGKGVTITARPLQDNVPWFVGLLVSWLPFIVLIGVWVFSVNAIGAAIRDCGAKLDKLGDMVNGGRDCSGTSS